MNEDINLEEFDEMYDRVWNSRKEEEKKSEEEKSR